MKWNGEDDITSVWHESTLKDMHISWGYDLGYTKTDVVYNKKKFIFLK